jgi:hypothetical protein
MDMIIPRIIHEHSAAIADPLFRRACGRRARPSDLRRTARVRLRSSGLRAKTRPAHHSRASTNVALIIPRAVDLTTRLGDFATNCHE